MKKILSCAAAWLAALLLLPAATAMAQGVQPAGAGSAEVAGHWRACPGCELPKADFRNKVLVDVNLSRANLTGANFSGATLRGVSFSGARLAGADFSGARFEPGLIGSTTFLGADLRGARLTGAHLGGVDLQYAKLDCSAFSAAASAGAIVGPAGNPGCPATARAQAAVAASWSCPNTDLSSLSSVVYVSSNGGQDSASCGQSANTPCLTIGRGLAQCTGANCGVLVAYGQYSLTSTIALASGKSIYGGCVAGTAASGNNSMVNAPPGGVPAISANGVTAARVQGLSIFGSDVTVVGGAPSIAVSLSASSNVTLSFVKITSGKGGTGTAGITGTAAVAGASATGQTGAASTCNAAGGQGGGGMTTDVQYNFTKVTSCPSNCGSDGCNGASGGNAAASLGGSGGGRPSAYCQLQCISSCNNLNGYGGSQGNAGSCGAGGAASGLTGGSYVNGVWTASVGASGTPGATGGGGGGGGGGAACGYVCFWVPDNKSGAAGGGGGAGACGATQGSGGQQGGASIGLQVVQSTTSLNSVTVNAGTGGAGGNGGANGAAAAGGAGASGYTPSGASPLAGTGGAGGAGGWGTSSGAGAGGNGGPTFGFVFVSSTPPSMAGNPTMLGSSGGVGLPGATAPQPSGAPCTSNPAVQGQPGQVSDYASFN